MKKVFMLFAVAAFFSATAISCGEAKEETTTEATEGEAGDHSDEDGHEGHDH